MSQIIIEKDYFVESINRQCIKTNTGCTDIVSSDLVTKKMAYNQMFGAYRLLQPHLLTERELIELLHSRCVSKETLVGMTKEKLVDLYNRVVLPLPQRECFAVSSRKKGDKVISTKKTAKPPDIEGNSYTIGFNGNNKADSERRSFESRVSTSNDRLKPPPDVIDYNNKKIRLHSSKRNDELDKIIIKKRKSQDSEQKTVESPEECSSANNNNGKDCEAVQTTSEPKKVSLKRSFTLQRSSSTKEDDDPSQNKKQRAKITWP